MKAVHLEISNKNELMASNKGTSLAISKNKQFLILFLLSSNNLLKISLLGM